jgi:hypothetical protein
MLSFDASPQHTLGDLRLAVVFTPVGDSWPQHAAPEVTDIADWR